MPYSASGLITEAGYQEQALALAVIERIPLDIASGQVDRFPSLKDKCSGRYREPLLLKVHVPRSDWSVITHESRVLVTDSAVHRSLTG
jgi:hypothetical protein